MSIDPSSGGARHRALEHFPNSREHASHQYDRKAILAYIAVCVFWGTSGPAIRYTSWFITPLWMVAFRFATAGMILYVALSFAGKRPPLRGIKRILPSALALSVSNILVTFGFNRVESGSGTLLLATTAVSFAVVDRLWPGGKTQPGLRVWGGLFLGLGGVAVLVLGRGNSTHSHWSGYIMLAISAWCWALGSVAQARFPSKMDPLQSSAWQMLIAAVVVLPFAVTFGAPFPYPIDPRGLYSLAFLIITASLIAFVGFVHMIRHMPPYVVGTYTYVNALVATLTGCLWLGERLDSRFFIAAVLVLSSVALIQFGNRRRGSMAS